MCFDRHLFRNSLISVRACYIPLNQSRAPTVLTKGMTRNYNKKILFPNFYFRCYTVHFVELLNYYTNYCTYIKFIKFTH